MAPNKTDLTKWDWTAFWEWRNSPKREVVSVRTNGDGTGFYRFKDGSKEFFNDGNEYYRIKVRFNVHFA